MKKPLQMKQLQYGFDKNQGSVIGRSMDYIVQCFLVECAIKRVLFNPLVVRQLEMGPHPDLDSETCPARTARSMTIQFRPCLFSANILLPEKALKQI